MQIRHWTAFVNKSQLRLRNKQNLYILYIAHQKQVETAHKTVNTYPGLISSAIYILYKTKKTDVIWVAICNIYIHFIPFLV